MTETDQLGELLLHDLRVVGARVTILELAEGQGVHLPKANRPVLHLVLEGMIWIRLDDPQAPRLSLRKGETTLVFYGDHHIVSECEQPVIVTSGVVESMTANPIVQQIGTGPANSVILSCILDLAYVSPAALAVRATPKIWSMKHDAEPGSQPLAGDPAQWRAALQGQGASAFATMLASLHFVHTMRDSYRQLWQSQSIEVRAPSTRGLSAAMLAMHMQPGRSWTVASMAYEVGVSRSRFAALFKATVGMSPLVYLTKIRMARAAELLQSQNIPLPEIARRSGYAVQTSFSRAFAVHHGQSPTSFLRNCGAAKANQIATPAQES